MTRRQAALKRAFDLGIAAVGLVLLLPFLAALMIGVRLTSPGPALYRQTRVGRGGRPFPMLKLRTMRHAPGHGGTHVTTAGDRRITRYGAFLRHYKLDELPQILNVLRGEMSFVGPRPDVPGYADRLEGEARRILSVRPGITGPATLCFRDEEEILAAAAEPVRRNDLVVYPVKTRLNLAYLDSWSFGRDLGYLLVTVVPAADRWLRLVPRETLPPDS